MQALRAVPTSASCNNYSHRWNENDMGIAFIDGRDELGIRLDRPVGISADLCRVDARVRLHQARSRTHLLLGLNRRIHRRGEATTIHGATMIAPIGSCYCRRAYGAHPERGLCELCSAS